MQTWKLAPITRSRERQTLFASDLNGRVVEKANGNRCYGEIDFGEWQAYLPFFRNTRSYSIEYIVYQTVV